MSTETYVKSGQPGAILLYWPLYFLPVCLVAAAIYSYAVVYVPIVGVVSFLLLGAYAFALVTTSGRAFRKAKCRSPFWGRVLGLIGGVVGLAAAWLFFLFALVNRYSEDGGITFAQLAFDPAGSWELIRSIGENGWFSVGKTQVQGWLAWTLWGIEALVIVISMLVWADLEVQREMFCERCDDWVPLEKVETRSLPPGLSAQAFKSLDGPAILALPEISELSPPIFITHEHLACPGCRMTRGHRLKLMTTKIDKKGKVSLEATDYPHLLLERAAR